MSFRFYPGSDPEQQLLTYLREKSLLLVLDNIEHLLDGADLLPEILKRAPNAKLLVTSRERLHLREEWVHDVGGLSYPKDSTPTPLDDFSAVQLFIQSARRAGYTPSDADTPSIIRICHLVEGMPLAVEMAAAWVRVIPCTAIASEIEHSLDILTTTIRNVPKKHRSIRAVFEHSWVLHSPEDQMVFRKLSVFRGGFTREAAAQVADATLSALASLVDKSWLRVDESGRYDLHELLRQYSREKLTASGEAKATLVRHQDYFLAFAERAEPGLFGGNQLEWLNRLEAEHGNLRAAIDWSLESGDIAASLRLSSALYFFWELHGHRREGYERLMVVLALPQTPVRTTMHAKALSAAGYLQFFENNFAVARPLLEKALAIAREGGDQLEIGRALRYLGPVLYSLGEHEAAGLALEESLALARQQHDRSGVAWSLVFLGDVALQRGNTAQAQRLYEEGIDVLRGLEDNVHLAYALRRLGLVMREHKDYGRAKVLCQESLELNLVSRDRRAVAASLVGLTGLAIVHEDTLRAARLLGAVETLVKDIAAHLLLPDRLEYEFHVRSIHTQLDTSTLNRAWAEGQSMSMEQVAEYALGDTTTLNQDRSDALSSSWPVVRQPLTERELEVLCLIAEGFSTREVAQQLFLSTGTIRWYLNQIYSKLAVHSRIQAITRARNLKLLV